jgi:long-chain acyl-CoA synthetase
LYSQLQKLVSAPILARLGGRLRLAAVGGAAVEPRISQTFIGLGLPLIQGYGLTEASPVVAANRLEDNEPFSVGRPLPGVEVRINEAHELLVRGPSVMQGYWRNPEASAVALAEDGWLNTGDQVDIRDGRVYIKGRTKDILVLSNGEKLPPDEVEMAILDDPLFEQVMLVGEGKPYLLLLAVTQETDEKLLVKRANERLKHFPRWVRVRRVIALQAPWTIDDGLLTPTMKVKRNVVCERFRAEIEKIYASRK